MFLAHRDEVVERIQGLLNARPSVNRGARDPAAVRDRGHETRVRDFLANWGAAVPAAADATPPDFDAQCAAMRAEAVKAGDLVAQIWDGAQRLLA
ncbi:MAG TPA: hypothetical protein VGK48_14470 [Terriglobia bacterium]|jgi:nitronate monooxygenase